jgi:hypothetical protein
MVAVMSASFLRISMDLRERLVSAAVALVFVLFLFSAILSRAESAENELGKGEGITSQKRVESPESAEKRGIGVSLKVLLAADAATRALDGYSTVRMLRNKCNGDRSVAVCNEEMFLPDFITHSQGSIYGYEAGAWVAQSFAVHKLAKRHPRLARLIPAIDIATALPFAVNNLRLPPKTKSR